MKLIITLFLILLITSCNKVESDGWTIFKIDKDNHSSSNAFEWTKKDNISFEFQFDSSAIYQTVDPVNQWDVNKLFGVSDGGFHTRNSARFGWRWVDNHLEILAFTHLNGNFYFEKICNAEIGKTYLCNLKLQKDYEFSCIDESNIWTKNMPRWAEAKGSRYYLWPYFGGDETAPHDITIKVRYTK
jgi:hypothetical protein